MTGTEGLAYADVDALIGKVQSLVHFDNHSPFQNVSGMCCLTQRNSGKVHRDSRLAVDNREAAAFQAAVGFICSCHCSVPDYFSLPLSGKSQWLRYFGLGHMRRAPLEQQRAGLDYMEFEQGSFINSQWNRSFTNGSLLTLTTFVHDNQLQVSEPRQVTFRFNYQF